MQSEPLLIAGTGAMACLFGARLAPHTDVTLKLLASEETSEAHRYMEVYDRVITPLTEEIEKVEIELNTLDPKMEDLAAQSAGLKHSLDIITPKIEADRVTLETARPATIFAIG